MAWDSDNWLEGGSTATGAVTGAAAGAQIGAFGGPVGAGIGAGVGALVGGVTSFITSNIARKKQEEAEAMAKKQMEEKRRKNLLDRYMARKQEESLTASRPQRKTPKGPVGVQNRTIEGNMAQMEKQINTPMAGTFG